ncbi:hypothetical protein BDP27DRAFT_1322158 [Rhodocollybia butyracea]|uniref:Uncharacterized protein n=1 Tax=Rhodocollybia butyracea TaxID=206335 RepID=A0A9P5U9Y4_9AGAR|nr:hypothetical protein BDP27DRAFT_1322158 [Rhodocollybia butyracea]
MSGQLVLHPEARALAIREARKEGVFAGLTSALASALFGSKVLGLKRYPVLACGAITAVLSGYYFTEAFTEAHLAKMNKELRQRAEAEEKREPNLSY